MSSRRVSTRRSVRKVGLTGPFEVARVKVTVEGNELIIHAMPLRAIYRKLLKP